MGDISTDLKQNEKRVREMIEEDVTTFFSSYETREE